MTRLVLLLATVSLFLSSAPWTGSPQALAADAPPDVATVVAAADVVVRVLSANRDVSLARRSVAGAEADIVAAKARPNPALTVGTSAIDPGRANAGALGDRPYDTVFQLSQLLERGGKRDLRGRAASAMAQVQREALEDTVRQQVLAARLSFYDLLQAQERLRVADETLTLFARTVAAATLRLKAGDISATDLARLRVDQLRAENDRRIAVADRERARQALAFLLGMEAEAGRLQAQGAWPAAVSPAGVDDIAPFLDRRPDVRAAARYVEVTDAQRELARTLRVRDVTVAAQWERYPTQIQDRTLGLSFSVPLFLNYDYAGELQRAEVNRQAAAELLARARAAATREIQRAAADVADALDRVARFEGELLAQATKAASAAELAYRNGALGVIDLLDARRVLYATRTDAVAARADLARSWARWRAAIAEPEGGGS